MIRTLTGDRPIEALKVGDQVLAQDTSVGALRYRSVTGVHHNPPAQTLRVKLKDEVILATGFHRFWKAGRGWIMARELKPGDMIRTLEGLIQVASIEPDRVQPVYNLDVADDAELPRRQARRPGPRQQPRRGHSRPLRCRVDGREVNSSEGPLMGDLERLIEGASTEVIARLEAGESLAAVAESTGLDAVALVAAIARVGLGDEGSGGPGLIQKSPAHPRLVKALSEPSLAALLPRAARPDRLALAAGLLQILDAWDASHAAAQEADDLGERSTAAYWHLIAHRREPDPGNALYWARRVGRHPIHVPLAEAVLAILESQNEPNLIPRLVPGGAWSPSAMIDLTTQARPGTPTEALARRLQRLEMVALLEASVGSVASSQ